MPLKGQSVMLQVDNMDDSIQYYESVLGFKCVARMSDDWANMERDNISIMFSERYGPEKNKKPAMTGSIYIFANPVDDLWEELKDRATISYPIETFDFGMREFAIVDCNGYLIQFGQGTD